VAFNHTKKAIKHISDMLKHVYTAVLSIKYTHSVGGKTGYVSKRIMKRPTMAEVKVEHPESGYLDLTNRVLTTMILFVPRVEQPLLTTTAIVNRNRLQYRRKGDTRLAKSSRPHRPPTSLCTTQRCDKWIAAVIAVLDPCVTQSSACADQKIDTAPTVYAVPSAETG
jgi:hypothetical protein